MLPLGVKAKAERNTDAVPLWRARDEFQIGRALDALMGSIPFGILAKLGQAERAYMAKVFSRDPHMKGPVLTVGTKHWSKGGEADNVVLLSDMSKRTSYGRDASTVNWECENCVAYVAVTRTRHNLIVVRPRTKLFYEYEQHARRVA